MYHTTGLTRDELLDLCARIHAANQETGERSWPPILGLYRGVVATLTYLRRHRVQAEIAEAVDVSQPTISRAVTALTPILGQVLAQYVPVAEQLRPGTQYIVDGTCSRAGPGPMHPSCTPASTTPPGSTSRSSATGTTTTGLAAGPRATDRAPQADTDDPLEKDSRPAPPPRATQHADSSPGRRARP